MARYVLTTDDIPYAHEFLAQPFGYHSPGLQRVLNVMRGLGPRGKYVVVCLEPYRRWGLACLPAGRGMPIEPCPDIEYTDLAAAERDVFVRRWRDLGGPPLNGREETGSC
ncbi:MAG: hypothetical protein U1E45_05465 [Geminicoccaceae bacterium]